MSLPDRFRDWFAARGWQPHPHQLALLAAKGDTLLIAPTGGGKTLAGFLPSLVDLANGGEGLHTLYLSPLKALTADIARNLAAPVSEMGLKVRIEDRTGDTSSAKRARQRVDPPNILLTTPESLALMTSYPEAPKIFKSLKRVVVDEIHALAESKRGDQTMLGIARLRSLAPGLTVTGLSATVSDPEALAAFMGGAEILRADPGPAPDIAMLPTSEPPPWAGGNAHYAVPDVMAAVAQARMTLIFVNTRAQAELFFQQLWEANPDNLPIGLHHGSLSREARQRVEQAMAEGALRAVVCTGSLDLGIDWGDVDLVLQVGAPKLVTRLVQRIGRSNHRYDAPSRARLVPANRFEVIESIVALEAVQARDLDGQPHGPGPLDVLCQHILLTACAGPFEADALFEEFRSSGPYQTLTRAQFDACLDFCATGGYALKAYDRWQRLMVRKGLWYLRDPRSAKLIRMNIGTITDPEQLNVRMARARGGAPLGTVEESFAASLEPGDMFLIGGRVVAFERLREMVVEVQNTPRKQPRIAVYSGVKMASSLQVSHRVQALIGEPEDWHRLPADIRDWLDMQRRLSVLPRAGVLACESFPRGGQWHLTIWGFAGRNAHQTLGLLISRRMEAMGLGPLGFVTTDYALMIWSVDPVDDPALLLRADTLQDGFDDWLAHNSLIKRTFRSVATIAGLMQRNLPGQRRSGKQATFSSDIIHDTLRRHDPDHLLLRITRDEARRGLVDYDRIEDMLRSNPLIDHARAPHVTPLSAPLLLEIGRVSVDGEGRERMMEREAERLMREAGLA
ncbi:ligase-associated DNA damage response DEXH box helicase [Rhodobacter sp. NTK016B]|uniref:ligase-associated DNA damage response DEXH box helicase n=1 Tax=Rhodobacter sp. NTK016B TaxID=2759676 RepID=UPI001A8F2C63|nr:ligase-associated DNA damage response DEXH box helicase [Rhodobacter sp. NTK016B]MBN8293521.1 ligase-associated DNA damage response DEXH box helicase [Rhodobacter sp. NTK016B]